MTLPDIDSARAWNADAWQDFEPTVDPSTELSATVAKSIAADVAAATHTQPRAMVRFSCATYTSGTQSMTVLDHDSVWGNASSIAPTVGQTSAGRLTITWGETQSDELGATHTINIRFPRAPVVIGATDGRARIVSFTTSSITIQLYDASGNANALNGNSVVVEW